ncbi:helix-turn-helix domain-containing protein [Nonomuraea sp. NPDC049695]|uniref:TetR/AcrR family transcriptional regulator n=1 Tax=Nonomuraea sp. NPDC049695 TaxID=3154734 RepID=UPI0034419304
MSSVREVLDRQDRRVLRSRAALMAAAVRLVTERGTTALPVADLAEAANVSRQLVYLQFGDRDALLVAAATDLVERELMPVAGDAGAPVRARVLAMARHFARHRPFYRAMLTGSCAFGMSQALNRLFGSLITREGLRATFGDLDDATAQDLATLISGGTGTIVNDWLIGAGDPLDPEELTDRLVRLSTVLTHGDRLR